MIQSLQQQSQPSKEMEEITDISAIESVLESENESHVNDSMISSSSSMFHHFVSPRKTSPNTILQLDEKNLESILGLKDMTEHQKVQELSNHILNHNNKVNDLVTQLDHLLNAYASLSEAFDQLRYSSTKDEVKTNLGLDPISLQYEIKALEAKLHLFQEREKLNMFNEIENRHVIELELRDKDKDAETLLNELILVKMDYATIRMQLDSAYHKITLLKKQLPKLNPKKSHLVKPKGAKLHQLHHSSSLTSSSTTSMTSTTSSSKVKDFGKSLFSGLTNFLDVPITTSINSNPIKQPIRQKSMKLGQKSRLDVSE